MEIARASSQLRLQVFSSYASSVSTRENFRTGRSLLIKRTGDQVLGVSGLCCCRSNRFLTVC